ncbi:permease, partial [Halorubrum distributum]
MLGSLLSGPGFLGTSPEMLALFAGFGLVVGVLFGFFGMGGSFLVTPALLMLDYPAPVAVGSGMAFVFGTAVIATLKHHDLGQVDYKLGVIMITGTTIGIEAGRASVYYLESMGLAGGVISIAYVVLLGGVGAMVTRDALKGDGGGGVGHEAADKDLDEYESP